MEKKKLSVKALMSLVLSAMLFCMPAGAFFANRANTVEVHAENTAEQQTESTGSTGNTVTPGNGKEENAGDGKTGDSTEGTAEGTTEETEPAKCTCTAKCSQYEVDKDCAVCSKDYKECAYVNPSVKITIATPTGWHNDTTKVHISVEDTVNPATLPSRKCRQKWRRIEAGRTLQRICMWRFPRTAPFMCRSLIRRERPMRKTVISSALISRSLP